MWFLNSSERNLPAPRLRAAVRLEAIGGQGANSAGKILAEAAVLGMGYTGNHFSSFGSEKRGTPVRSFVRYSTLHEPVRSASFISRPDVLAVFHESLIHTHPEILQGVSDSTDLLINSTRSPSEMRFPAGARVRALHLVDASDISRKEGCGLNIAMLGALSHLCPEIRVGELEEVSVRFFASRGKASGDAILRGFRAAARKTRTYVYDPDRVEPLETRPSLPELGWMNAPMGGVIVNPGNTVLKDHSASRRGTAPKFERGLCCDCGYCDMVCPDFCFVWTDETGTPQLKGIDYQYCKGCQKCVSVCPVDALAVVPEDQITEEERALKRFPDALAVLTAEAKK